MRGRQDRILLIDAGDLPSLTAIAIQADASRLVLWHPQGTDAAGTHRADVVRHHAQRLGVSEAIITPGWCFRGPEQAAGDPGEEVDDRSLDEALLLVQAAIVARRIGAGRIIWPIQAGSDPDEVLTRVERAATVSDLTEIEWRRANDQGRGGPPRAIDVDLPLVDLDDEQIVDLAEDAGAPLAAFWPCETGSPDPCEDDDLCPGCRRWRLAFEKAGRQWPLGSGLSVRG